MPKVNHRRDHDDATFCPLVSMVCRKWVPCIEGQCEFWTTSRDDSYSQCAVNLIAKSASNIDFTVSHDC